MNKQLKLLNAYSSKVCETQPFTLKQVLQLRDGIETVKNQNIFFSPKVLCILKNLTQQTAVNQLSPKIMEKLEAVQKVLRFSTPIRDWCNNEFSVYFDDFDEQNVDDYNSGGYGDIADEILERGIKEKLIEEDDLV